MNTKALKQKILDLAIHGKLVPQNPDDEPASKLIERIREEKAKLVAEKKIKADKNDSYIFVGDDKRRYEKMPDGTVKDIEDEIPFDVPEGWAWCRLGEICDLKAGKSISATDIFSDNSDAKYLCYGGNGIRGYVKTYNRDGDYVLIGRQGALCGNINYAFGKFYATEHAVVVENRIDIDIGCLGLFLETLNLNQYATSTAQPGLSVKTISEVFFPLPPLNEQCRIVERIKRLFNLIDSLEKDRTDLQIAVKQAKSKILDLAIHGKLVEQDSSDEPASVLLEKLRAEKEIKIKAGELKRDKNDSYIYKSTTDNCHYEKFADGSICEIDVPFEIPESWSWSRLGSICDYGKCKNASADELSEDSWILDLEDIEKDTGKILKFVHYNDRKSLSTKHVFYKGDLLYSKLRPYLNKVVIAPKDGFCTSEILPLDFKGVLTNEYGQYLFMSSYFLEIVNFLTYGVKMPRLGTDDARKILIPIPPIPEQKRIVSKIEEVFKQLDTISAQIE